MTRSRPGTGPALTVLLLTLLVGGPSPSGGSEPAPPDRIVALAPSVVELLFAVGCGERVVGVGDWAAWPEEARSLPRLGGLYDPHLEEIVALQPDLVVALPSEAEVSDRLDELDMEVLTVESDSLEDVAETARTLARRCGFPDGSLEVVRRLEAALNPEPVVEGKSVLLVVGHRPGALDDLTAVGPGTYLHQLAERLGAVNVLADSPAPYPRVGLEEVVSLAPDLVVELHGRTLDSELRRSLLDDWEELPGGDPPPVRILDGDWVLVPGARLPRLVEALAGALRPEGEP